LPCFEAPLYCAARPPATRSGGTNVTGAFGAAISGAHTRQLAPSSPKCWQAPPPPLFSPPIRASCYRQQISPPYLVSGRFPSATSAAPARDLAKSRPRGLELELWFELGLGGPRGNVQICAHIRLPPKRPEQRARQQPDASGPPNTEQRETGNISPPLIVRR